MNYIDIDTTRVPEMLTIRQAAERFGFSEYAIRKLVHSGKIVFIRPGGPRGPVYINCDRFIDYLNGRGDGNA